MAAGYDYTFVDPVPDALVCLICTFVAREPQQTVCCGKVYCKDCLDGLERHSTKCPQCREELQCFPDKRSKPYINLVSQFVDLLSHESLSFCDQVIVISRT